MLALVPAIQAGEKRAQERRCLLPTPAFAVELPEADGREDTCPYGFSMQTCPFEI